MARCEDIELLLGPFEDGELEPHEMQEVARHTAVCAACDGVLAGYRSMAVALRGAQPIPALDGFTRSVMTQIKRMHLPPPIPRRHWYDAVSDWFANAMMMGGAVAAVAIVTAVLLTPEVNHLFGGNRHAHANDLAMITPGAPLAQKVTPPADAAGGGSDDNSDGVAKADPGTGDDSGTVISSLKSDNPSVAVWTEPETKTTVVWVPDQQP